MWAKDVLLNSQAMLVLAIISGFLFPDIGSFIGSYMVVVIAMLMTVSMRKVSIRGLTSYQWRDVLGLLAVNYAVLSSVYFLVAWLLFDGVYQSSIILLGLMPPAVGIISLTYLLDGALETSFVAEVFGYALSLFLIPLGMHLSLGDTVSLWSIGKVLVYMIIMPFIVSRGVRWAESNAAVLTEERFKIVFNISYASAFFGSIALNRDRILANPETALWMAAVLLSVRVVMSVMTHSWLKSRLRHPLDVDFVLFSSLKNGGAALGFAVMLFGAEATLPLAVNAAAAATHIVLLESYFLPRTR